MSDRAILFLFSVLVVVASLAAAGWLLVTGQADSVDGLFLLLTCLVLAFAFSLYIVFLVRRALESLETSQGQTAKSAPAPAKAAAQPATAKSPAQATPTSPAHSG